MSSLAFTKMHGLGNDFVVLQGPFSITTERVRQLCDRHTGVGADGLLVISPAGDDIKMEYWNNDGSTAEMCGNGLRCAVRFAVENQLVRPGEFSVQTAVGPLKVVWDGEDPEAIEVQVGKVIAATDPVTVCGQTFYEASVGNPHAITFVDSAVEAPVTTLGPQVEKDSHFPNKTNVEFAQVVEGDRLRLRIWERGVGETLACGTGMVAAATVASRLGKTKFPVTVEVPGGNATIWQDDEGYARMRGPAEVVFSGRFEGGSTV